MYRALRRHYNIKKAIRKQKLARKLYGHDWYNSLYQYSDNKIHCSCQMCRFKSVWNPNNKPIQDLRHIESMNNQLKEYYKIA